MNAIVWNPVVPQQPHICYLWRSQSLCTTVYCDGIAFGDEQYAYNAGQMLRCLSRIRTLDRLRRLYRALFCCSSLIYAILRSCEGSKLAV